MRMVTLMVGLVMSGCGPIEGAWSFTFPRAVETREGFTTSPEEHVVTVKLDGANHALVTIEPCTIVLRARATWLAELDGADQQQECTMLYTAILYGPKTTAGDEASQASFERRLIVSSMRFESSGAEAHLVYDGTAWPADDVKYDVVGRRQ
jgi:hypothetical protein